MPTSPPPSLIFSYAEGVIEHHEWDTVAMFSNEVYTVGTTKYCELKNCVISNQAECGTGSFVEPSLLYLGT